MTRVRLDPDPRAVQRARAFVAEELAAAHQELSDDAQLLVSELVTNAIVHAASAVEVDVELDADGAVVRVKDADTGPLVLRKESASELDEGGRGFILVDRLADAWGTDHHGGRKTVWFRLGLAGRPNVETPAAVLAAVDAEADASRRRLRTLLLRPAVQQALTFEQHLHELLGRIMAALGADGAEIILTGGTEPAASLGGPATGHRCNEEIVLDGASLGTLTISTQAEPDDEALAFLALAAGRLALLVAEHGILRADHERTADLDYTSEATELLTGSTSVSVSLTLLTQIVVPRISEWSAAYVVDERGRPRRVMSNHRREDRADDLNQVLDNDRELVAAVADAASGAPAKRLAATIGVSGQRSHALVAPLASRSRTRGVLVLGRSSPWDAVNFMAVLELARRAALAVDNAALHEERAAAANALQASLLPSALPQLDGHELAARYHSASPGLSVGGDFYDAFALADGSLIVAIGDVCGKGAEAAAVTGTARDLLRLLLQDGVALADALRRLNRALTNHPSSSRFCTVALVRIAPDRSSTSARICLAGHPEPVLLRANGTTELVGEPGDLLGVLPDDELGLIETEVQLGAGDALVLYTDGITERRNGRHMFGQHGVRRVLQRSAGVDAEHLAREIENAARTFVDTELRDDLAVLVVRRSV